MQAYCDEKSYGPDLSSQGRVKLDGPYSSVP